MVRFVVVNGTPVLGLMRRTVEFVGANEKSINVLVILPEPPPTAVGVANVDHVTVFWSSLDTQPGVAAVLLVHQSIVVMLLLPTM